MRFHALACDYDGTLATDGRVDGSVVRALQGLADSGRKLILVTGRQLDDLFSVFPDTALFDWIVAENGAVLHHPDTHNTLILGEPPPEPFVARLRAHGVDPVSTGNVIVATWHPHENTVLEIIRELGLELQVIFNKGAVMILPSGLNKAFGLKAALREMALSVHNVAGVGDAENDHAFLSICECSVAVANALPSLKEKVDWITSSARGEGVRELIDALITDDLAQIQTRLHRHALSLGTRTDGSELHIFPHGSPILLAGTSGSGKSTLATAFMEALIDRDYQFCVIDPEGDYGDLAPAVAIGNQQQAPDVGEVMRVLESPENNVIVNLLGIGLKGKPLFTESLLAALDRLRERTGRPHWIIMDEAHQLLPPGPAQSRREAFEDMLLITVHPEHVDRAVVSQADPVIVVGQAPARTLAAFSTAAGLPYPGAAIPSLDTDEAVFWSPRSGSPPCVFRRAPTLTERRRHERKYAEGELGPDKSFYFRGPDHRLHLRAHNLLLFVEIADGVDDETWNYHLRRGDFSRWLREAIKDEELAEAVGAVEKTPDLPAEKSREAVRRHIEAKYAAPP